MIDPQELSEWLADNYALSRPIECQILRAYTNDVFVVQSAGDQCILKVYGSGWRTDSEVRYEVALLRHLSAKGLSVAVPVVGNNDFVRTFDTRDGYRHAVLFAFAPGEKPQPPFTTELYGAFGRAVAHMHELSADFVTQHQRRPLDLNYLIDEPLIQVAPLLENPDDRAYLTALAGQLKDRITAFASEGLDWGPVHGDATLDNLHVTADGEVVLYDFDSGGPGWRAADLQGWAANHREHREKWDAFLRGYSSARRLNEVDILAAPYLTIAWDIWGMKIDLDNRVIGQGRERTRAYLQDQMALLRVRAGYTSFSRR